MFYFLNTETKELFESEEDLRGCKNLINLSKREFYFDKMKCETYCCSAKEDIELFDKIINEEDDDFLPEEKNKCIETCEIWQLIWYPDTNIKSCSIRASTLQAILQYFETEILQQKGNVMNKKQFENLADELMQLRCRLGFTNFNEFMKHLVDRTEAEYQLMQIELYLKRINKMEKVLKFYENGRLKSESFYTDNLSFDSNKPVGYRNPKYVLHNPNGPAAQSFYENGQLKCQEFYIDGKFHNENGPALQEWYPNGQLKMQRYYNNDDLHNPNGPACKEWDENGQLTEYF